MDFSKTVKEATVQYLDVVVIIIYPLENTRNLNTRIIICLVNHQVSCRFLNRRIDYSKDKVSTQ